MDNLITTISDNWLDIIVPIIIFGAALITLLWLRKRALLSLNKIINKSNWPGNRILIHSLKRPSIFWCIIISALLALAASSTTTYWKNIIAKGFWSVFIVTFTFALITIINGFSAIILLQYKQHKNVINLVKNILMVIVITIGIFILLDTWAISTTYLLISIIIILIILALVFRDIAPNIIASIQLNTAGQFKVGDYIKIESGEEGYIAATGWRNIELKTLEDNTIIIPNNRLTKSTIVNYGHLLKKASEPFRFNNRMHLTRLTGLKARNLQELADILKNAPDDIVYYHTHHFLEEQYYTVPQLSNDFAVWVDTALGDDILAERLASIGPFDFPGIGALRDRLVGIINEYINTTNNFREAEPGRDFYFMTTVSVIIPTTYVAHDLREFTEALRKISLGSLYFHIFESKLRLGKGLNDFTVWINDDLGEKELADEIARIDPYTYTLEGLRSSLIQRIEKRIK